VTTTGDTEPETLATFEARSPRATRRYVTAAVVALVGVTALVLGYLAVTGEGSVTVPTATLVPTVVLPVLLLFRERDVELTEAGLAVDGSLREWEEFDGFTLTDDALRVTADGLFGTREFDRADIEDPDAVAETLEEFLPRVDT
jgi:hypothetical protein